MLRICFANFIPLIFFSSSLIDSGVIGFIEGYDETGLYINETKVPFDLIRHVMLIETTKWYE